VGNLVNQHVRFIETGEFLTYPKPDLGSSENRLIERKQMSTKTTFKRIALVAVAAMGFGTLSVAPSSAAIGSPTLPVFLSTASLWDGTSTFAAAYTAGTAGVARTSGLIATSMTAFTVPLNTATTLKVTASGSAFGTDDIFDFSLNGTIVSSNVGTAAITTAITAYTFAKVGTYAGNIRYYQTATTRVAATATFDIPFTVTVGALDAFSPPLSTFLMGQTSVGSTATDVLATYGAGAVATLPVGMLSVALKNVKGTQTGGALTATSEVSITGPGFVKYDAGNTYSATGCTSAALRSANNAGADVAHGYFICGDGTSGVATINIRVQDEDGLWTTLASKSVTMYGAVTTLTSTATYTVGKAGGGTVGVNTAARTASTVIPAVIVHAVDKNGVGVGGLTIKLLSSDVTVANTDSSGACNADTPDDAVGTNAYSSGGVGYYNCALVTPSSATAGKSATLTWRVLDPADTVNGTAYLTTTTAITIGGAIKTSTLSFDKATYGPGDAIVYSVVTKDAAGGTPYDGQAAYGATATANKSFGGTMPGTTKLIKNGSHTSSATAPTLFAPVSIGAVTMTALDGTGLAYMSATATVVDAAATTAAAEAAAGSSAAADAAAEATDAANAATDAANAAAEAADAATAAAQDASDAVAALSAQVAEMIAGLKAQLTALTNLVIKIQKKVKA